MAIQDRTAEFHAQVSAVSRKLKRPPSAQRHLLEDEKRAVVKGGRGEFARRAAEIGRSINTTMGKLERLANLAKRKTIFDDKPVEIAELTYVIKQDLSAINSQISNLQALTKAQNAAKSQGEAGEHAKNVVVLLQGKLADVSVGFKEVLEVRTKNIQAGKARTENFVSSVSSRVGEQGHLGASSSSPLYSLSNTPQPGGTLSRRNTPQPSASPSLLNLDPSGSYNQQQSQSQLMAMEEGAGASTYISARGEAIEAIERTITELGGIFGQLATMVREQHDMVQRIDQDTEDTVVHIEGAQAELMKYWARVSSNRMLFLKMFGVLMIFFLLWVLVSG